MIEIKVQDQIGYWDWDSLWNITWYKYRYGLNFQHLRTLTFSWWYEWWLQCWCVDVTWPCSVSAVPGPAQAIASSRPQSRGCVCTRDGGVTQSGRAADNGGGLLTREQCTPLTAHQHQKRERGYSVVSRLCRLRSPDTGPVTIRTSDSDHSDHGQEIPS